MNNIFESLFEHNDNDEDVGLHILNEIYGHTDLNEICKYHDLESFGKLCKNQINFFKILHINACCLTNKFDNIKVMLKSLKSQPDVLCITETWLESNNKDYFKLKGYSVFHLTRTSRTHGGIAVFVKSDIKVSRIHELSFINDDIEILTIELALMNKKYNILTIYRPQTKHHRIMEFIDIMNEILINPNIKNNNMIILGDLNINLLEYTTHSNTNSFLTYMQSLNFIPLISRATRFPFEGQQGSPSLLDHIYANFSTNYYPGILHHNFSDHLPVFLHIPTPKVHSNTTHQKLIRVIKHANKVNFRQQLIDTNWNDLIKNESIDNDCESVISHLNNIFNSTCPLLTIQISNRRLENPWITSGIIKSSRNKNKLFKDYKIGAVSYEQYCKYRNLFNKIVQQSKKTYYKNIFSNFKHNTKKIWETINELQSKFKTKQNYELEINGKKITNPKEVSEEFNRFYTNIAPKLNRSLPDSDIDPLSYLRGNFVDSMGVPVVNEATTAMTIRSLKNKKNNINEIPVELIKENADHIAKPMTKLFNNSIRSGVFPQCLKYSTVIPLYKSGPKSDPGNYRPISLMSTFSKIFESLMKRILTEYLESKSILSTKQFGFRANKSTFQCVNALTSDLFSALDNHQTAILILVDFTKAFDTVQHQILLRKMWHYGIRGVIHDWFASYLRDRFQVTSCDNIHSSKSRISYGVPQGSILGPLLFLLYINDLPNIFSSFHTLLFADDSSFYLIGSDIKSLIYRSNVELEKFYKWALSNRLTVNISKTKYLIITKKKYQIIPPVFFHFDPLERVAFHKILGVYLDDNLSFRIHINELCQKLSRSIALVNQVKNYMPLYVLKCLYHSQFMPHLLYCLPVWGSTYPSLLQPLFILQKKIIRIITNSNYDAHTNPLFTSLRLLKFFDLVKLDIGCYMFKNKNNNSFNRLLHTYNTRNRNNLLTPIHELSLFQNSLAFRGPHLWNLLPENLRNARSIYAFKKIYKNHILNTY